MNSNNNDELADLIARCALKDRAALKSLYDRLNGYLYAMALRLLKHHAWAQEALQDTFVQIWQNAQTYRPHLSKPLTWITSILRYRAIDKLTAELQHPKASDTKIIEEDLANLPGDQCPMMETHHLKMGERLIKCMEFLGPNIRQSIELAYWQGLSREEIAAQLQTNANTVKSWLHRGALRLKECLT